MQIYPSITTDIHDNQVPGWKEQLKEVEKLELKKIGLFPTRLDLETRKVLYEKLDNLKIEIPFVHVVHNTVAWEMEHYIKKYHTKFFNIHEQTKDPLENDLSKYKDLICVENCRVIFSMNELIDYPRLCIDFAHLEGTRLQQPEVYDYFIDKIKTVGIIFGHVSAIKSKLHYYPEKNQYLYDWHVYKNLNEFNYLKKYKKYMPEILFLELENSIEEQLKAIKYIEDILK